ncbi:MAG: hypothetical protein ACLQNE_15315 [Thermoguttaceae bacterium]
MLEPDFLSAAVGKGAVVIRNASQETVKVSAPKGVPRGFTATVARRSLPPGAETELVFQAAPFLVVPSDEEFTLDCTHSVEKNVVVTVKVRPKGAIRVDPPDVSFGVLTRLELLPRVVTISLAGDLLAEVEAGEVRAPDYFVLDSNRAGKRVTRALVFHIRDAFHGADLGGAIIIPFRHRGSKGAFSIEIPVSGFVTDARGNRARRSNVSRNTIQ